MGSFTGASIEVGRRPRVEAPVTALQSFSLQRNLSICFGENYSTVNIKFRYSLILSSLHPIQLYYSYQNVQHYYYYYYRCLIINVCPISSKKKIKFIINDSSMTKGKTSNFEKCLMSKILLLLIYLYCRI